MPKTYSDLRVEYDRESNTTYYYDNDNHGGTGRLTGIIDHGRFSGCHDSHEWNASMTNSIWVGKNKSSNSND